MRGGEKNPASSLRVGILGRITMMKGENIPHLFGCMGKDIEEYCKVR